VLDEATPEDLAFFVAMRNIERKEEVKAIRRAQAHNGKQR